MFGTFTWTPAGVLQPEQGALYTNGKLLEEKSGDKVFMFRVPLAGKVKLEARSGKFSDQCTIRYVDMPNPAYTLQGKSSNSANWV